MTNIFGTNLNDELFGTDLADAIKGLFDNDRIDRGFCFFPIPLEIENSSLE